MPATFRVSTDALNVRAGPGVQNPILAVVTEGALLSAAGAAPVQVETSTWINITTASGVAGWVNSGFVTEVQPPAPKQFRVTATALNLRAGPSPDVAILAELPNGAILSAAGGEPVLLADGNTWINVTSPAGVTGWVNARFVVTVGGEPIVTGGSSNGVSGEKLAWGAKVDAAFRDRVRAIAGTLGFEPDLLMAAIAFESAGSFSPSIRNPLSGATGLIQFMPSTARDLGTTVEALAAMSAVAQLDFVEKYLARFSGKIKTIEDLYMSILLPVAVGRANDFALFTKGTIAYEQNAGLDSNGNGVITKGEASRHVAERLEEGRRPANLG